MITVALLHLDLCCGPQARNHSRLLDAIAQAADMGADWIVTPETALQGYFWALDGVAGQLDEQTPDFMTAFQDLARERGVTLFLGTAELEAKTWRKYNSCIVISADGECIGAHRKLRGHGSAEAWATRSTVLDPIQTKPITAGVLICADSWYAEYAQSMKDQGADVLIVPSAWPPGNCGPGECWEQRSAETGLPVWVCNQTGSHPRLDFQQATSVVVQDGKTVLSYHGAQEAVLLFQWDHQTNRLEKPDWVVAPVSDAPGQECLQAAV